jgi:ATP-dependent RNA helicase DDX56/DBP9
MARARTGSGKTIAYGVPLIHGVLQVQQAAEASGSPARGVRAVILVPTRELCDQVRDQLRHLLFFCDQKVRLVSIPGDVSRATQVPLLRELPEIIVSTPTRLVEHLKAGTLVLNETLNTLVVDEADLVLSYGYKEDLDTIRDYLPRVHQTVLMSATLTPEVESLRALVLRNPAILKVRQ